MVMKTIQIKNQKEFDNIKDNFEWRIEIIWDLEKIDRCFNNVYVVVYGNATIKYVYGNATIKYVSDNATIKSVSGNATIESVSDNATIKSVYGNATIEYVSDNATIKSVSGNATIESVSDNATIKSVSDNATIKYVYGNATIESVSDNATIIMFWLASLVLLYWAKKIIAKWINLIRQIGNENINMELWENVSFIQIKEVIKENPIFDMYKKLYPVEVKWNKAILYKAVHKIDWRYISDYDKNFEYKIGETIKWEIDRNQNNSCSVWLHISHLKRAIDFGRVWEDKAILECEVPIKDIVVSKDCDWKVRTSQLKVLRELPKEER